MSTIAHQRHEHRLAAPTRAELRDPAYQAFSLLRVAFTRLRAGHRPWNGDRRHLAHRLAGKGLGRRSIVATLSLVALPSVALGFAGVSEKAPALLGLGLMLSTALYTLVCYRTGQDQTLGMA